MMKAPLDSCDRPARSGLLRSESATKGVRRPIPRTRVVHRCRLDSCSNVSGLL
jgi:hypothetical protein